MNRRLAFATLTALLAAGLAALACSSDDSSTPACTSVNGAACVNPDQFDSALAPYDAPSVDVNVAADAATDTQATPDAGGDANDGATSPDANDAAALEDASDG